ncbi:MAG: hypothetical protein KIT73_07475 [Burkholderiales bacterium]|nr:hypothetical protein [Burkholderiales bacterium]
MKRHHTHLAIAAALLMGSTIGALGGYLYARNVADEHALEELHRNAATDLKSYERIRSLVQNQEYEKLTRYLDGLIHIHSTLVRATAHEPNVTAVPEND